MSELMSLEDLAQVDRWNKTDMRHGRAYATQPSVMQITQMIKSIEEAHKLKQRVEKMESVLKDAQELIRWVHCGPDQSNLDKEIEEVLNDARK